MKIMDENLKNFLELKKMEGLSETSIKNYETALTKLHNFLNKNFRNATKEDIELFLKQIEKECKYSTLGKYKILIKSFYKWLEGDDEVYPHKVRWIKHKQKKNIPVVTLTEDEVFQMVRSTTNCRDRAIILTLFDTGMRLGELEGIKIGDVRRSEKYIEIYITTSKTKPRPVLVITGYKYLAEWLDHHPDADNEDARLFPITPRQIETIIGEAARRTGKKKKVTPHTFRRTCATMLKDEGVSEHVITEYGGWEYGSKVLRKYLKRSGKVTRDAILEKRGILEEKKKVRLTERKCAFCGETNLPNARFCSICGKPLDMKVALKIKKDVDYFVNVVLNDPQVIKRIAELRKRDMKVK